MDRKYHQHLALAVLYFFVNTVCLASNWHPQVDIQADAHYSRYNFTDIKRPYDGIDGWLELKLALWDINENDKYARPKFKPLYKCDSSHYDRI